MLKLIYLTIFLISSHKERSENMKVLNKIFTKLKQIIVKLPQLFSLVKINVNIIVINLRK